jgi:hypothetical protein
MHREKDAPPSKPRAETTTIVAFRKFAAKVRTIADRRDITMAEVLDRYAGGGIDREYKKVVDELGRDVGGEG